MSDATAPKFLNSSQRPVFLDTWRLSSPGLSNYEGTTVAAGAEIPLPESTTGEWIVSDEKYERIGKFRTEAAMDRRYAWTVDPAYRITWTPETAPVRYTLEPARLS